MPNKEEYAAHKEYYRDSNKVWRESHKEERRISHAVYYGLHKENNKARGADWNRNIKQTVMSHYGSVCQCCGESNLVFLTIDHVNGGGTKQIKELGGGGGALYRWLRDNGYPSGFQVLCWNCNSAKHILGVCPHQAMTSIMSEELQMVLAHGL